MKRVYQIVALLAVISVALCLVPAGAHLFELARKMSLSPAEYMTVQKIYAGWSFFGIAIVSALFLTLTHTFMVRGDRARRPIATPATSLPRLRRSPACRGPRTLENSTDVDAALEKGFHFACAVAH